MFPLTDQLAEKVSTMMTPRPDGRPNSRAKDLVDVDIIAATQYVDLRELRLALAVQQQRANTDLGRHLRVPPHWEPRYQSLATGTSAAAVAPTFADAVDLAARFINPALDAVRTVRTTWGQRPWNGRSGREAPQQARIVGCELRIGVDKALKTVLHPPLSCATVHSGMTFAGWTT